MPAIRVPYLGRPENMIALPAPNDAIEMGSSRGEAVSTLLSGATGVSAGLDEKRSWPLPYQFLPAADAEILRGFYLRAFGLGPFVFVDHSVRNVLPFDVSTCGVRSQAGHGWTATSRTLTRTGSGPTGVRGTGVLSWSGFTASTSVIPTFSTMTAPVALNTEAFTASLWVKASAAATMTLRIDGFDAAGTLVTNAPAQTVSVTTAWQQFTITAAVGALTTPLYALPRLLAPASSLPASVQIAAAQVEYNDSRTPWQFGNGSPRVLPSTPLTRSVQKIGFTNHTFTLAEQ